MKKLSIDNRRHLIIPGNKATTLDFCVSHFLECYEKALDDHKFFSVALSGGSTPKAIYSKLINASIDWSKVFLFFSDERAVPPTSDESNYKMAEESGFSAIKPPHLYRMVAEKDLPQNAASYEELIKKKLKGLPFDYIMLGMGDDGHTASLFPESDALDEKKKLVTANYVAQKKAWRMTFTFPLINSANHAVIYVIGEEKAAMLKTVLTEKDPSKLPPSGKVGSEEHPALWIVDDKASKLLLEAL